MISIVIPALNEADALPQTLARISLQSASNETLVVDGGSSDDTVAIARAAGANTLRSTTPGRAAQMNLGANAARGDVLLFLHADTWLPPEGLAAVEASLRDPQTVGGAFDRVFDSPSLFLRCSCRLAAWRGRRWGLFFGDQAIFARTATFQALGGYRTMPHFEDFDLSRRLRACGRTVLVSARVISSARRFTARGPVRTTLADLLITARYVRSPSATAPQK